MGSSLRSDKTFVSLYNVLVTYVKQLRILIKSTLLHTASLIKVNPLVLELCPHRRSVCEGMVSLESF